MVKPMTSFTGYVTYINYTSTQAKGDLAANTLLNGVFQLGAMNEARRDYSSSRVVESFTGDGATAAFALAWAADIDANDKLIGGNVTVAGSATTAYTAATSNGVTTVTFTSAPANNAAIRIGYVYDNVVIPQRDLPGLKAEMKGIALEAKARRLAIAYSQIAAFQAKTDYGMDLGQQLANQATGELQYEIDSEVVDLLNSAAQPITACNFYKTLPVGVNKKDHYEGFAECIEAARTAVYTRTQKFNPNYMVCARDVIQVLSFMNGWNPAGVAAVNGPYFAGTVDGLKVFVSPQLAAGKYFIGVNGNDLMTSAAVYAPYMPIVPTTLLGMPDGTMTQGFSTMYDLKLLSRGKFVSTADHTTEVVIDGEFVSTDDGTKSPLLVAGTITA